jgi:hypothetical protein
MPPKHPDAEPDDLYTRDFLIRVRNTVQRDFHSDKGKSHSSVLSFAVSGLSMVAITVHQLATIRVIAWDIQLIFLVLITGVVSFALTRIFETLFFGER